MAVIKLGSGNYQAKLLSLDRSTWVTQVFPTKSEAFELLGPLQFALPFFPFPAG